MFTHFFTKIGCFTLLLMFIGCTPNDEGNTIPLPTSICVQTKHHDIAQPNMTVFLKYNSDTFPGYTQPASFYDTMLTTDQNGRACVSPVPVGRHWIIALGVDEHAQQVLPIYGRLPVLIDLERKPKVDTIIYVYE